MVSELPSMETVRPQRVQRVDGNGAATAGMAESEDPERLRDEIDDAADDEEREEAAESADGAGCAVSRPADGRWATWVCRRRMLVISMAVVRKAVVRFGYQVGSGGSRNSSARELS